MLGNNSFDRLMSSSLFSLSKDASLFTKPTVEISPLNYVAGGVLSLFTLNNFLDTYNNKFSRGVKLKELNLRDIYNILSISTIFVPLAGVVQGTLNYYNTYSTSLYQQYLPGNSIYTLLGGAYIIYNSVETLKSFGRLLTPHRSLGDALTIGKTGLVIGGVLGSAYFRSWMPLGASFMASSVINKLFGSGNINNGSHALKNAAVFVGISAGIIYNSKWILESVGPWAQAINVWNFTALQLFKSFDVISGRYGNKSAFDASVATLLTLASLGSLGTAAYAGVVMGGAHFIMVTCLNADWAYKWSVNWADKLVSVGSVTYMAPTILGSIYGAMPAVLTSASTFIPSLSIPTFLSSAVLQVSSLAAAGASQLGSAATLAMPYLTPLAPAVLPGLALATGVATVYVFTSPWYKNWVEAAYNNPKHILYDENGNREYSIFHPVTNLFKFLRESYNFRLRGGMMMPIALGVTGLVFATTVFSGVLATALFFQPLTPFITTAALNLAAMLPVSGWAATIANIAVVGTAFGIVGALRGMLKDDVRATALKWGGFAGGGMLMLSFFGMGGGAALFAIAAVSKAAPIALSASAGIMVVSPIITTGLTFAFEKKKPEYVVKAEALLTSVTELNKKLHNIDFNIHNQLQAANNNTATVHMNVNPQIALPVGIAALPAIQLAQVPAAAPGAAPAPVGNIIVVNKYNQLIENLQKFCCELSSKHKLNPTEQRRMLTIGQALLADINEFEQKIHNYYGSQILGQMNNQNEVAKIQEILEGMRHCKNMLEELNKVEMYTGRNR